MEAIKTVIKNQIEYHDTKIDERVRGEDYIGAYMHECKIAELQHLLLIIDPALKAMEEERSELFHHFALLLIEAKEAAKFHGNDWTTSKSLLTADTVLQKHSK